MKQRNEDLDRGAGHDFEAAKREVGLVKAADAAPEVLRGGLSPVRFVFGVESLPLGTPVEVETVFEVC